MELRADASEILKQLNDRGYRNITPDQLKEFMKDLKKLIKYDTTPKETRSHTDAINTHSHDLPYMTQTKSSEAKMNLRTNSIKTNNNLKGTQCNDDTTCTSATTIEYPRRTLSLSELSNSKFTNPQQNKKSKMWIRPNTKANKNKKCDPVQLYHAYQADWERFKENIPIDNKHLDLRWEIRQKTHKI